MMAPKEACRFIVGLLHLAATCDCEARLAQTVLELINGNKPLSLKWLQEKFGYEHCQTPPSVEVGQHRLSGYNTLIPGCQEQAHV